MPTRSPASVTPSAARLTASLRDIGYDFPSAVADIVDNSVAAGARTVDIQIEFDGEDSRVLIFDDGCGMSGNGLIEALRYGTRRDYEPSDLGRYGLGLKTASLSQCRSVLVASRSSAAVVRTSVRMLDLDLIAELDDWLVVDPGRSDVVSRAREWLASRTGTVVAWQKLDRVLPEKRPDGAWARRRLDTLSGKTAAHLGMVFHRFLEGCSGRRLSITVNGEQVLPWDPFAPDERNRMVLPSQRFEVEVDGTTGAVTLKSYVLPPREKFSSPEEFDRLSGPMNWNRQQGMYIYRADRLVQWGGWNGIRGIDEHTKLARASLDFDTDLDTIFNINVAKMRVTVPPQLRHMLERPVNELCIRADDVYRKLSRRSGRPARPGRAVPWLTDSSTLPTNSDAGLALRAAAMKVGEYEALKKILKEMRATAPDVIAALGL